jgi:hypothetical protein
MHKGNVVSISQSLWVGTLQEFNSRFARPYGISIDVNAKATPPLVGTHRRNTQRIPRQTRLSLPAEFERVLAAADSVQALKQVLSEHLRIHGEALPAARFLVFGERNRLLSGNISLSEPNDPEGADQLDWNGDEDAYDNLVVHDFSYLEDIEAATVEIPDDLPVATKYIIILCTRVRPRGIMSGCNPPLIYFATMQSPRRSQKPA